MLLTLAELESETPRLESHVQCNRCRGCSRTGSQVREKAVAELTIEPGSALDVDQSASLRFCIISSRTTPSIPAKGDGLRVSRHEGDS